MKCEESQSSLETMFYHSTAFVGYSYIVLGEVLPVSLWLSSPIGITKAPKFCQPTECYEYTLGGTLIGESASWLDRKQCHANVGLSQRNIDM